MEEVIKEQLEQGQEQIMSRARSLAMTFTDVSRGRTWFKPIHIKREVKGETEATIELKLDMLVELGLAVKKKIDHNGAWKYMITLTTDQKIAYNLEYKEWLNTELEKVDSILQELKY